MAYSDFTLDRAVDELGVALGMVYLFPGLAALAVPAWLQESLSRGMELALLSEKARSEFIVAPILLACRELSQNAFAIYSGQNLPADPSKGLVGECDFILARTEPLPVLRAPLVTIVEAKRSEIELSLGQCVAQMVGARLFNEKAGTSASPVFGCVTTGELWQFLKLEDRQLGIDRRHHHIANLGGILAMFAAVPP